MNKYAALMLLASQLGLLSPLVYGDDVPAGALDFSAQVVPFSDEGLPRISGELVKGFKNQASLYTSVATLEGQATFKNINATGNIPGKLHLIYNLNEYAYDFDPIHVPDGPYTPVSCAFDGTTYQELRKNTGELVLSKVNRFVSLPLLMDNFFLLPYAYFLNEERINDAGIILKPVDLADSSLWTNFIHDLSIKGAATVLNTKTVVAELDVASEAYTGLPGKVRFYFNPQSGYYPMGWDVTDNAGRVIDLYRVTNVGWVEVKKGVLLPYPKAAIREFFWKRGANGAIDLSDKPVISQDIEISSLNINSPIPEGSFTISPSLANFIYDGSANTFIDVPK